MAASDDFLTYQKHQISQLKIDSIIFVYVVSGNYRHFHVIYTESVLATQGK